MYDVECEKADVRIQELLLLKGRIAVDRRDVTERTKRFALRIIRLVATIPRSRVGDVIGRQLLRSGTSIGANYREASRASTKKHFTSILTVSLREADETLYWLELLAESQTVKPELLTDLLDESRQIVAILAASVKTANSKNSRQNPPKLRST